jgi:hypothetical protein
MVKIYRKCIICLLFALFYFKNASSQYALAGSLGGIYKDISPDTLISPTLYTWPQFRLFNIDLNQDGTEDIEIKANREPTHLAGNFTVLVSSLNSSTDLLFGSIDSTFHTYPAGCSQSSWWQIRTILGIKQIGDTIKNDIYVQSGYLGYSYSGGAGPCSWDAYSPQWVGIGDVFIGVRFQTGSNTSYGWIKVNTSNYYEVEIKEFSLGAPSFADISSVEFNHSFEVYPNPTRDIMNITISDLNFEKSELEIMDLTGKVLIHEFTTASQWKLNINAIPDGIYLIRVKTKDVFLTKKVLIQRH